MSNALAIAGVSAVLKKLLEDGIIEQNINDTVGQEVQVSAIAPDAIGLTPLAKPTLNLFLHQVTPNGAWRNVELPSRDARGNRLTNPPLALDLHYLLTAYAADDLQAEVLLGFAMLLLHELPVLARQVIRTILDPPPPPTPSSIHEALRVTDLAEQVELVKITPASMNVEEMSRLWSSFKAHYRPTASYHVSVVLIESQRPSRSAPPVLSRGQVDPATQRERGVVVEPSLLPPLPEIDGVTPPGGQPAARLGDTVDVTGHHLLGTGREVTLTNEQFRIEATVAALATGGDGLLQFQVPNTPADLPVGAYLLTADVVPPAEADARRTNRLPLLIGPEITTTLPMFIARDADGVATITLTCRPEVRQGQRASLVLGDREVIAESFTAPASTLTFRFEAAPAGNHLARLRVAGVDSPIINRAESPPVFFNHRITIT